MKASTIDVIAYSSPAKGTSFSNEVICAFSGDSGAVRQAIVAARDVGRGLLGALGHTPSPRPLPTSEETDQ
ncbi:BMC domain-containing protein [Tessaracoccus coleopterorum]|uniref:BMC domain-containing protein n=1 Tax=Tessaracoccus coleopterorum TaxID=2714950 RepID=UPI002F913BCD